MTETKNVVGWIAEWKPHNGAYEGRREAKMEGDMGDFDVDNFEQVFQDLEYQTWIVVSNLVDFKDRILKNEHERILREGVTEYEVKKLIAMTRKMDAIKDNFVDIGLIGINHNPAIEEALRD